MQHRLRDPGSATITRCRPVRAQQQVGRRCRDGWTLRVQHGEPGPGLVPGQRRASEIDLPLDQVRPVPRSAYDITKYGVPSTSPTSYAHDVVGVRAAGCRPLGGSGRGCRACAQLSASAFTATWTGAVVAVEPRRGRSADPSRSTWVRRPSRAGRTRSVVCLISRTNSEGAQVTEARDNLTRSRPGATASGSPASSWPRSSAFAGSADGCCWPPRTPEARRTLLLVSTGSTPSRAAAGSPPGCTWSRRTARGRRTGR
jgi:hypothetical protein